MSKKKSSNYFAADKVVKVVLGNGLRVLLFPDSSAPVAAIVTRVNAGYFDETDDIVGIAHVLEHMYFKGTPTRGVGDIAKQTKASGGYLNAHTIYDNTTYYTVLPADGLHAGLEIQADAYANSLIDADELARELEVIIQEAKRKSDNPSAVATETTFELLHDRHRIRRWRIGREDGLRKLARGQMLAFYRNFYKPSNTILAVAGDFNAGDLLKDVERLYGYLPAGESVRDPGPVETTPAGFRYRELAADIAQSQVVIGWRTPDAYDERTPALDFAASILATGRASRLYRAVRERKLASSVYASNYTPTQLGVFTLHSEGDHNTCTQAAQAMWWAVKRLREEEPAAREVERVKSVFESRWMRRLETMEGKANYLADWEGLGDWKMGARYFDQFMRVSAADVTEAVNEFLVPERAAVLVYRPTGEPAVAAGERELLSLLESGVSEGLDPAVAAEPPALSVQNIATQKTVEAGVVVFHSAGGIPILVRQRASPMIYMEIELSGGSAAEKMEVAGISNLAVRATLKGTKNYSAEQIASLAEEMGGSITAGVGRDSSTWSLSVPQNRFEQGAALLAEVVLNATLADDALETERHAILSNLAHLRDDMYAYPMRLATLAAFSGHPYGIPVSGSEETVKGLTGAAVRGWYEDHLKKGEWVVGVLGDVDPQQAGNTIASVLDGLTQGRKHMIPRVSWPQRAETVFETRDKAQTALALAFDGAGRRDPDRYVAAMIATVASGLGGRFFEELRDKQSLAYTVHAFSASHPAGGMFLSYIATSPEKEDAARAGLLLQFQEFSSSLVSEDELERGKRYAIGTHAIAQEHGASLLSEMLSAYTVGGGLSELAEYAEQIRAVTAEQMREFARRKFDPATRVEGIIRGVRRQV